MINSIDELKQSIDQAFDGVRIIDIHTHLFPKSFGDLFKYGIDDLLTYHYLVAEAFRFSDLPYDRFLEMTRKEQAEFVWNALFVENTPISESARSVLTVFKKLGLDVNNKDIEYYRNYFSSIVNFDEYVDKVFEIAGLEYVVMTNDPFNDYERDIWERKYKKDDRFKTALRLDSLLNTCDKAFAKMRALGYNVDAGLSDSSINDIKRFLNDWIDRMGALYCAASLPPTFSLNDSSLRSAIIERCIIPVCRAKNIPLAMMIGVRRNVNPLLSMAADSLGKTEVKEIENLCARYPGNKFMVTLLSLENQHNLMVAARKFRNLMVFGCWWFLNNSSIIEDITRMRFEMLGTSFIPQHSDSRILEQLISKWDISKAIISEVLFEQYVKLMETGYSITADIIKRDIENLLGGNFRKFLKLELKADYDKKYYMTDHLY